MSLNRLPDPREIPWDEGEREGLPLRQMLRVLRRFWRFVRPYRGKFFLAIAMLLIAVPLAQFALFLTRDVTNQALLAVNLTADERWNIVLTIVGLQASFWLASALLATWREVLEWYCSMRSTFDLRLAFYRHLHRLPLSFLSRRTPGEHLYRSTTDMVSMFRSSRDGVAMSWYSNDVDPFDPGIMGMIVRTVPLVVETVYSLAWGAALLYLIDPTLSVMLVAYVVPFAVFSHLMYNRVRRTAFGYKLRTEIETGVLRDSIAGLRTLKAFGRLPFQLVRFVRAATRSRRRGLHQIFQLVMTQNVLQAGMRWTFATCIYVFVAVRVMQGEATIGDWVATFLLVEAAQEPLEKFVQLLQLMRMQMVPAQRVLETMDVEPDLEDPPNAPKVPPLQGEIAFEGVQFSYAPGRPALKGIDFTIRPGEYVGIVGPSGAGKSSLVALLLRLYGADQGRILIDGNDVRKVELQSVLEQVGTVPQMTYLYTGTIADNVLFGDPRATEADLLRAVRQAGVADFAARFPAGLETEIGEGATISGGERQRIGIARALIRNPKVLILDEATASLDPATEDAILRTVDGMREGRTILSIAHRLKAVSGCDRILVLQEGEIVQIGSHAELVDQPGLYRQLWEEQNRESAVGSSGGAS